jgi:TolB-like protein
MPDVFLSYSREDQASARRFADALQREGFSVWWDQSLRSGESYDEVTEQALKSARAVVVLWSGASVASRWVRAEATIADRAGTLVPVMIEPCDRPVMFELRQSADLAGWQGATSDPRWTAFVEDLRYRLRRPAEAVSPPPVPASAPAPEPARSGRNRVALAAMALLVLALLGAGLWRLASSPERAAPQAGPEPEPASEQAATLAVLPFANLSSDPEQEHFADGLTEELLNSLARIDGLQVTSRTSAFYFKGRSDELKVIGEKLGVDNLLEGSVRKDGNQLRITAQLIKAGDGFHLWSKIFDRPAQDIFKVQEEIARSVAEALEVTLGVGELGALPGMTSDIQAYEAYLEGQAQTRRNDMASYLRAADQFELATKRDPAFLLAWLELSDAYRTAATAKFGPEGDAMRERADEALEEVKRRSPVPLLAQALEISRELPRGDWGRVERGRSVLEAAAREFRHVRALQGNNAYDLLSMSVDKAQRAIPGLERQQRLDPLAVRHSVNLAGAYARAGRTADAFAELDRGLAISPTALQARHAVLLACTTGDSRVLEDRWQRLAAIDREEFTQKMFALRHRGEDVRRQLRARLEAGTVESDGQSDGQWAACFEDPELALQIQRAISHPERRILSVMAVWHPVMASVRRLPGFKDFVRERGLVEYWREFGWGEHCQPLGDTDFECR